MPEPNIEFPIFVEDINEQEELSLDCYKVTSNLYHRLRYQGASPLLIDAMQEIYSHFYHAHEKLKEIRKCFPPMDGEQVG